MIDLDEFQALMDEYLATLDDEHVRGWEEWNTPRELTRAPLGKFMEWLREKQNRQPS